MCTLCTFINVPACCAVSRKTGQTGTSKGSICVTTLCKTVAVVSSESTFVNIVANCSISCEATQTLTLETSMDVDTRCHGSTVVFVFKALMDIHTIFPVTTETNITGTVVPTGKVCAGCVSMAIVVKLGQTFIDIFEKHTLKKKVSKSLHGAPLTLFGEKFFRCHRIVLKM